MGNAYTAFAQGVEGIFYNPAGLIHHKGLSFSLLNTQIYGNKTVGKIALGGIEFNGNFDNEQDLESDFDLLFDNPVRFGFNFIPAIQIGNFAFGGFLFNKSRFVARNQVFPEITLQFWNDTGVWGAYAMKHSLGNRWTVSSGILAKNLWRRGYNWEGLNYGEALERIQDTESLGENALDDFDSEHGFGVDLGQIYTYGLDKPPLTQHGPLPKGSRFVHFAWSWQHVGDVRFGEPQEEGAFPSIPQQVNIGMGYESLSTLFDFRASAEMRHVSQEGGELRQKLHGGLEVAIPTMAFRAGVMHTKLTLGYDLDFLIGRLRLSTWAQDAAPTPKVDRDRYYLVEFKVVGL
jgi:hypothetical protein